MKFCPSCGAQLTEGARFCENCGVAVTPAAPPTVPAPPPEYAAQPPYAGSAEPPVWSPEPAPAAPRKSRRGLLTGLAGAAAVGVLGVVGYFVYDHFTGPNGGADSPSAAVVELSAAADGEDAVTALSLLPPGEVGPIVDLYQDVQAKATSTGVTAKDHPFAGFDVHVKGVAVRTEQLGPDVAAVTVTGGTVSWTLDPDKLQGPLRIDDHGNVRQASKGSKDLVELTRNAANGQPLRLMTVKRDGKWYVSPMYTLLELWRSEQGLPSPDFSKQLDLSGTGADSATAAVQQAAQSLSRYDVDGFLDLLSPDEAGALYQYRDAILTSLQQDGALARLQSQAQLAVDAVNATAGKAVDGRVPVTVRSASGSINDVNGNHITWSLDRNCVNYAQNGDSGGGCLDDVFKYNRMDSKLASQFPSLTLLTQQVDGRWYLSPMATIVADLRRVVAKLDADDVASMLGVPQFGGVDGQLKAGKAVQASVDAAHPYALFDMDVPAGKVFSACMDGGFGPWLFAPDGRPVNAPAVLAKDGGHYRLLASNEDAGSFTITPMLTDVEAVAVPGSIPAGGNGQCGARIYSFDATAGQGLMFTVAGNDGVTVTTPSGNTVFGSGFMPKESGTHLLTVPGDAAVTVEPLPADVLTVGSEVNGTLTGSAPATYRVFVDAGQHAEIQVYGDGSVLPSIELYDQSGSMVGSDSAGYAGYAGVTPSAYDGVAAVYELKVFDVWNDSGGFLVTVVGH